MRHDLIDGVEVPGINKGAIIEAGKKMVANGMSGRAAAIELYREYFSETNVQSTTRERRLKHLARKFKAAQIG